MNALLHRISRMGEAVSNRFRGNMATYGVLRDQFRAVGVWLGIILCFAFSSISVFAKANTTDLFAVAEEEVVAWENTLDGYVAGTLNTRVPHTVLPAPPPVLARLLADDGCGADLRVIIYKSILDKTFGKTASKFTGDFHKISIADMRNLLTELANPIAIFDSAHGNGDKVVLTAFKDTETGESVIVAIKVNVPGNNAERVNAVASIHGRKLGSFHKWLKDGLLRYYHTKKFPQWLVSVGVQNPRASIPRGNEILTEKDVRKGAFVTKKRKAKK